MNRKWKTTTGNISSICRVLWLSIYKHNFPTQFPGYTQITFKKKMH